MAINREDSSFSFLFERLQGQINVAKSSSKALDQLLTRGWEDDLSAIRPVFRGQEGISLNPEGYIIPTENRRLTLALLPITTNWEGHFILPLVISQGRACFHPDFWELFRNLATTNQQLTSTLTSDIQLRSTAEAEEYYDEKPAVHSEHQFQKLSRRELIELTGQEEAAWIRPQFSNQNGPATRLAIVRQQNSFSMEKSTVRLVSLPTAIKRYDFIQLSWEHYMEESLGSIYQGGWGVTEYVGSFRQILSQPQFNLNRNEKRSLTETAAIITSSTVYLDLLRLFPDDLMSNLTRFNRFLK